MELKILNENYLEVCARIYVETFNDAPWHDHWDETSAYNRLNEIYRTPGFLGMLVLEHQAVIGAVFGNLETWFEGYMYNLKEMFVIKEKKGSGIGSFLFKGLEEELKKHDVISLCLFTSKGDFTEMFYLNNGCIKETDMIMMTKDLMLERGL